MEHREVRKKVFKLLNGLVGMVEVIDNPLDKDIIIDTDLKFNYNICKITVLFNEIAYSESLWDEIRNYSYIEFDIPVTVYEMDNERHYANNLLAVMEIEFSNIMSELYDLLYDIEDLDNVEIEKKLNEHLQTIIDRKSKNL